MLNFFFFPLYSRYHKPLQTFEFNIVVSKSDSTADKVEKPHDYFQDLMPWGKMLQIPCDNI